MTKINFLVTHIVAILILGFQLTELLISLYMCFWNNELIWLQNSKGTKSIQI